MWRGVCGVDSSDVALQPQNFLCQNVHRAVVLRELPFHHYKRLSSHSRAIAVVDVGPHDHIRHSRFVLDQEKDDSFGGFRSLASDDQTRYLTFDAGLQILKIAIERESGR